MGCCGCCGCCVEGVWDKEGMSVGLVEIALKGSDI